MSVDSASNWRQISDTPLQVALHSFERRLRERPARAEAREKACETNSAKAPVKRRLCSDWAKRDSKTVKKGEYSSVISDGKTGRLSQQQIRFLIWLRQEVRHLESLNSSAARSLLRDGIESTGLTVPLLGRRSDLPRRHRTYALSA